MEEDDFFALMNLESVVCVDCDTKLKNNDHEIHVEDCRFNNCQTCGKTMTGSSCCTTRILCRGCSNRDNCCEICAAVVSRAKSARK